MGSNALGQSVIHHLLSKLYKHTSVVITTNLCVVV